MICTVRVDSVEDTVRCTCREPGSVITLIVTSVSSSGMWEVENEKVPCSSMPAGAGAALARTPRPAASGATHPSRKLTVATATDVGPGNCGSTTRKESPFSGSSTTGVSRARCFPSTRRRNKSSTLRAARRGISATDSFIDWYCSCRLLRCCST
jgi:hypothetical protein